MDQLGEDAAERRLADVITADALAVASVCFAFASLLAMGLFQFLVFVVGETSGPTVQFVLSALPVLAFALVGVFAARTAWQRGVSHPTYAALAGAGLLLSGVIALVAAAGIVVALVAGDL